MVVVVEVVSTVVSSGSCVRTTSGLQGIPGGLRTRALISNRVSFHTRRHKNPGGGEGGISGVCGSDIQWFVVHQRWFIRLLLRYDHYLNHLTFGLHSDLQSCGPSYIIRALFRALVI